MRYRFIPALLAILSMSQLVAQSEQEFKEGNEAIVSFSKELAKWHQGVPEMRQKVVGRLMSLSGQSDFVRLQAVEMYINTSAELEYCKQYEALIYGNNLPLKLQADMVNDNRKKIKEHTEVILRLLDILSRLPAPEGAKSKLPK